MKKILYVLILFLINIPRIMGLEINSKNVILYNMNENKVIFERNANEVISIASLTKIMTTIVAIENIDDLDKMVTITSNDYKGLYDASLAGFSVGQTLSYRDLLYGTFLPSGAEATQALANNISGSVEGFVELMNKKASELGMNNTHFSNTTGLDDKDNYSTVEDVAKLLKYALKNDTFYEIYKSYTYTTSFGKILSSSFRYTAYVNNCSMPSIIGGKTGYTDDAGRCLASTAYDKKNAVLYMLVTCRADTDISKAYHVKDTYNIYNYYFNNYKYQTIFDKGEVLIKIKAKNSWNDYVNFYADDKIRYYLQNDYDTSKIKLEYEGLDEIDQSIKKNTKLGTLSIYYDNEKIIEKDIILNNEYHFSLIKYLIGKKAFYILIFLLIFIFIKKIDKHLSYKNN